MKRSSRDFFTQKIEINWLYLLGYKTFKLISLIQLLSKATRKRGIGYVFRTTIK